MKRLVIIAVGLLACRLATAQPLTANEMLEMVQCTTNACFERQLLPKGYDADVSDESEDYSVYQYYSKTSEPYDDNEKVVLPNKVEFALTGKAYIVSVNFTTGNRDNYESILNDFRKCGFVIVPDEKNVSDQHSDVYMNAAMPGMKLIVTIYHKDKNEQKFTEYGFKINRMTDPPRNEIEAHKALFAEVE